MIKVMLTGLITIMVVCSGAQQWNPYVAKGMVSPDPLLPVEFTGVGTFSFVIGNHGTDPLKLVVNQEMTLIVTLSYGVPGHEDPLEAIGGTWAGMFIWQYESAYNTYLGKQNQEIPAESRGDISILYRVVKNSPATSPQNGFNVNLQPPPYSNGINDTRDDAVSCYAYVRARDYGDAPTSYGTAMHDINIFKYPETGAYENFIYLGESIDPETEDQPSVAADRDDLTGIDDEDGVIFPLLIRGDTAVIQVTVTVHDFGTGILNAWCDWNGDGVFNDPSEKLPGTPLAIFTSGQYPLTFKVPDTAVIDRPTFARFRIGAPCGPTGPNTWGEVEDYQVVIKAHGLEIEVQKEDVLPPGASTGSISLKVQGGTPPYSFSWSNGATTDAITNLSEGTYSVIVLDSGNFAAKKSISVNSSISYDH